MPTEAELDWMIAVETAPGQDAEHAGSENNKQEVAGRQAHPRRPAHGAAHGLHAVHQCRQSRAGSSRCPLRLLLGHKMEEHDANEREHRSEGRGLEQLKQQASSR